MVFIYGFAVACHIVQVKLIYKNMFLFCEMQQEAEKSYGQTGRTKVMMLLGIDSYALTPDSKYKR